MTQRPVPQAARWVGWLLLVVAVLFIVLGAMIGWYGSVSVLGQALFDLGILVVLSLVVAFAALRSK